jgi:K+/H+ antiporter YhaU regulatory subunit KhtT
MLTSSFVSQLIICDVKEEQQVRAAKAMRPKRPTMETADNHQSRSIGDIRIASSTQTTINNTTYLPFQEGGSR